MLKILNRMVCDGTDGMVFQNYFSNTFHVSKVTCRLSNQNSSSGPDLLTECVLANESFLFTTTLIYPGRIWVIGKCYTAFTRCPAGFTHTPFCKGQRPSI